MPSRRSFVKWSAAASGALGLGALPKLGFGASTEELWTPRPAGKARESLRILVIGGTGFTGPEQVEHALARGHRVTVINRNRRRPDFFKGKTELEQMTGAIPPDMSAP